jgi:UDP-N-acetylglucosamine acyltransferase
MSNRIHPTAIIGPNVKLGKNNVIGPYCVFSGKVEIGDENVFVSHVSVGQAPQHRKFDHLKSNMDEVGTVIIGSRNVFREFVTVHQPYITETKVGSDCFIMSYAHISHDTILEDFVTVANSSQIGGHCVLMQNCNLGLSTCLHQYTVIGSYTMVGMGSVSSKNLIPFNKFVGSPTAKRVGINKIGLERLGFGPDELHAIDEWSKKYLLGPEASLDLPALTSHIDRYEAYCAERDYK